MKGVRMKKEQKPRKKLLTGTGHPLLNLKEVIDTLLREAEGLPSDVKQMLVQTRDVAWKAFVERQEKLNNSLR
jgi:hypothetical protein